jgi:hypothetical protein
MSSLQKFHRRTQVSGVGAVAPVLGSGSSTKGYYLGKAGDNTSYMYVAPKSTEVLRAWGSPYTTRNTISTTDGIGNTNTLNAFGSAAHPAAYYCKTLATGGYNTWYLPAKDELNTCWSNHTATPFATADAFVGNYYWVSTESDATFAWQQTFSTGAAGLTHKGAGQYPCRAVRRSIS